MPKIIRTASSNTIVFSPQCTEAFLSRGIMCQNRVRERVNQRSFLGQGCRKKGPDEKSHAMRTGYHEVLGGLRAPNKSPECVLVRMNRVFVTGRRNSSRAVPIWRPCRTRFHLRVLYENVTVEKCNDNTANTGYCLGLFFSTQILIFVPATFCRAPDRQFSCWEAGRLGSVWMDPFEKWVLNFQRGNVSESRNVWPSDKSFRFCKQKTFFFEVQSFVGGEF